MKIDYSQCYRINVPILTNITIHRKVLYKEHFTYIGKD